MIIYIIIAMAVLAADIISKIAAKVNLAVIDTIPVIRNVFHLTYVENRGMAFGMLSGGRIILVLMSVLIMAGLVLLIVKTDAAGRTRWLKGGTALIFGGAVGNLIERIANGYVVDFLDFRIISFPVFNIADIAVCVGAAMLMIHFFISGGDEEPAETEEEISE